MAEYKLVPVEPTREMVDAASGWPLTAFGLAEERRDKRLAERDAEIAWLKKTLAIPPGYRLQPISEFDAMESARIESDALRGDYARLLDRAAEFERDANNLREGERAADAEIERLRARVAELEAERDRLRELVGELVDDDDCWFDHHGYCQAHGWCDTEPACPHARGKALAGKQPPEGE